VLATVSRETTFLSNLTTVTRLSWVWTAGGFVVAVALLGPAARSSLWERVGDWSRSAETVARIALLASFVALAWVVHEVFGVQQRILTGVASGAFLAVAVFVALHVVSRMTVEGW